ncbi:MAG: hypothetical protein ABIJ59_18030 [Pseudomonadota bacterium]
MPIPNVYKNMAIKIRPFQRRFFFTAIFGFFLLALSILLSNQFKLNLLILHGISFFLFLWGWGLFLVINWYGKESKNKKKLSHSLVVFGEWFAAIFLNIWFIFGSAGILLFMLS